MPAPASFTTLCFVASAILYVFVIVIYWHDLIRSKPMSWPAVRTASIVLAALLHGCLIVSDVRANGLSALGEIYQTLLMTSLLIVFLFMILRRAYPTTETLGAFVMPLVLLLFLGAAPHPYLSQPVRGWHSVLLGIHVGVNVIGTAAFGLAFVTALAYLTQENALRHKRLGPIFQHLPALELMDRVALAASLVGFVLLTAGLAIGALILVSTNEHTLTLTQVFGILTWICFAVVLGLRYGAGWQGRRAARGTILGFAFVILVLAGYLWRAWMN